MAGLLLGLLLAAPFAGTLLHGTEALLPAYAAAVPAFASKRAELQAKVDAYRRCAGASCP